MSVLTEEFRLQLVEGGKGDGCFWRSCFEACKERGYLKVQGRERADSPHVLVALHYLSKWKRTAETMQATLNILATADPD